MQRSYLDTEAPIVALATPAGVAALAVIRASGPGSVERAAACFSRPAALRGAQGHGLVHGFLLDPATGERIDEVLAAVFRAPRGPFGEDGVELSCHGSPLVVRRALAVLEAAGFRLALPGEFSFRAFLHGRGDLVRAEAVAELAAARTERGRAEALKRLEGGLSRRVGEAREALVGLLADVQARLDYPDDELESGDGEVAAAIDAVRGRIAGLASSYAAGRLYGSGGRVVLAGRPNAGKSSLFNLILREERAIVAPEPGTTRDWIEAEVDLDGIPARLVDTAGIREAEGTVEAEGVARSLRLAAEAEAVVYLVDCAVGLAAEDEAFLERRPDAVRVWSKCDSSARLSAPAGFVAASAATGEGLRALLAAVARALEAAAGAAPDGAAVSLDGPPAAREALVASERQKRLLDRAAAALGAAAGGLEAGAPLDAVALDLREAQDALGEMTGEIASEEVLESIFSRFCVGK